MKTLLTLFLLFTTTQAFAFGDKVAHFGVSAALVGTLYIFPMFGLKGETKQQKSISLFGAAGMTLMLGLAKEVSDAQNGHLDGGDMAANILGTLAMTVLIYHLDIKGTPTSNGISFPID